MADDDTATFTRQVQERYRNAGRKPGKARPHRPQKPCRSEGCDGWAWAQGYCDNHYQKLKRQGVIQAKRIVNDPVARFHASYKVNEETGCWEWQRWTTRRGYGEIRFGGNSKNVKAHRFSYELYHGPIPEGMHVLHECDRRICANPSHLFLGSDLTNALDCSQKGRAAWQNGGLTRKLTPPMVMTIRVLYARGRHSYCLLADIYRIDEETVRRIVKGEAHLR